MIQRFFFPKKNKVLVLWWTTTQRNSLCICKHVLRKIRRRKKTVCSRCNGPPAKEEFSSDSISTRRQDICGHILLSIMACANRYQLLRKRHNLTHHQDTMLEMEFLGRKEKQCRNWSVARYRKEFSRPWSVNEWFFLTTKLCFQDFSCSIFEWFSFIMFSRRSEFLCRQ